jgi:hypothetical protein
MLTSQMIFHYLIYNPRFSEVYFLFGYFNLKFLLITFPIYLFLW